MGSRRKFRERNKARKEKKLKENELKRKLEKRRKIKRIVLGRNNETAHYFIYLVQNCFRLTKIRSRWLILEIDKPMYTNSASE